MSLEKENGAERGIKIYPPERDVRKFMKEYIKEKIPSCVLGEIGKSIMGEPIDLYRIGHGKINVLYVGAHHGSEYITSSLLYSFLLKLQEPGESLYEIDKELYFNTFSLFIVPVLNPDGVDISLFGIDEASPLAPRQRKMAGSADISRWKANARGVDLNHNYPFGYMEYKKLELARNILPGPTLYSGECAESEPETSALLSLIRSVDFSLIVSLHAQGEEIYYFPSGSPRAEYIANSLAESLGYNISSPTGTACYGGLSDYTGEVMNIPSFTLEVGRGENPLPEEELIRINSPLCRALFRLPIYI